MPRALAPSKYAPLVAWLQALPDGQERATLTVAEIDTLLGGSLPLTARTKGFWAQAAVRQLRSIGFHGRFDHTDSCVVFTRITP
jgi:hypothetical protein